jgi:hypothetical protein
MVYICVLGEKRGWKANMDILASRAENADSNISKRVTESDYALLSVLRGLGLRLVAQSGRETLVLNVG